VSKLAAEHYCRVFHELYGLETVALRYFNVYGPRQRPDATYAAVIPLFVDALLKGRDPVVHGDGMQSRDFTYVSDVVAANLAAAEAPEARCAGNVYNVAAGETWSLLDLLQMFGNLLGVEPHPRAKLSLLDRLDRHWETPARQVDGDSLVVHPHERVTGIEEDRAWPAWSGTGHTPIIMMP
jgi:nucleoside-diphosphate-sugar epimerase